MDSLFKGKTYLSLLTVLFLFLFISYQTGSLAAYTFSPSLSPSLSPSPGPLPTPLPASTKTAIAQQAKVVTQVYNLNQRLSKALRNFASSPVQKVHILSQSTADPAYDSPEKLLQYPAGAWEFTFCLDKTQEIFRYQEVLECDRLALLKKSGVLRYDVGKGWQKVRIRDLDQPPYEFAKVKSLDQLPFLFIDPSSPLSSEAGTKVGGNSSSKIGGPSEPKVIGPSDCNVIKVAPQQRGKTSHVTSASELPNEILFWITSNGEPHLKAARYFWVSEQPGGTLYTVSQVDFSE